MAEAIFGHLFKIRNITYKNQKYKIYEYKDFVTGIKFTNTDNDVLLHILTGNYIGIYSSTLGSENNNAEYITITRNINESINKIKKVNFNEIRKNEMKEIKSKYYLKKNNDTLSSIIDQELLNFLNNTDSNNFDETAFEKSTDISVMYSSIKKTIVSQDEQIMQILTSLFKNQKVVNSNFDIDLIAKLKEHILIYGPTGTGKTEILKRIAKLYDIPIVIEDATSLSETGYQGRKITDMLESLYLAANEDIEIAEKGILVIDEFDKLAEKYGDSQSHVSRAGVQRSLLKLLDGTLFYINNQPFNTSKLTVVGLGAFTGITKENNYKNLTTEDFKKYGIMQELIGRFSKTIAMNNLTKEDIEKILITSNFSPLNTYKELFNSMSIEFEYNEEFVHWLAEQAILLNSGARSLKTVFDNCISSAMFRIFAGEYTNISLIKPESPTAKPYILTKK